MASNAVFVSWRREQGEMRICARDGEFNPALVVGEGLIGCDFETELFCVEVQSPILIANWDADDSYAANHFVPPL